jgi:hypothetical protein
MAASNDSLATFTIDLGSAKKVNRFDTYFVMPTAGHAYQLDYSTDGKTWTHCGGHTDVQIQSPHMDLLTITAQYLRVTFIKGMPGIWEVVVY